MEQRNVPDLLLHEERIAAVTELIDTTEMYLKTVFEMKEDGVTPLRARIVERLGHSGPTVSQTISRMERDGLVHVGRDRRVELTDTGHDRAVSVMRKHRLAERLLLDVIGMEWEEIHDEACRWEHVMSDKAESRLAMILDETDSDPFGNPVPGPSYHVEEKQHSSAEAVDVHGVVPRARITRIGEPVQAEPGMLGLLKNMHILPGTVVSLTPVHDDVQVVPEADQEHVITLPGRLALHLFVSIL